MNEFLAVVKHVYLKNYVNFEGRANRKEFWYAFLFSFIISFILGWFGKTGTILSCIWSLAILLPT